MATIIRLKHWRHDLQLQGIPADDVRLWLVSVPNAARAVSISQLRYWLGIDFYQYMNQPDYEDDLYTAERNRMLRMFLPLSVRLQQLDGYLFLPGASADAVRPRDRVTLPFVWVYERHRRP